MTCSMDKSDDLLSAEEPNDEFYHDNTIEDPMNYWTVFWTIGNETADDISAENEFEKIKFPKT